MALKPTYIQYTLSYTCKYFIILSTCKYFIIWNKILFYFLSGFTWLEVTLEHCCITPLYWVQTDLWSNTEYLHSTLLNDSRFQGVRSLHSSLREISQSQLSTALLNFSHWCWETDQRFVTVETRDLFRQTGIKLLMSAIN